MKKLLVASVLFICAMSSCNRNTAMSSSNMALVGTSWQFHQSGDVRYEPKTGVKTIHMLLQDGKLTGFLGCNNLSGSYVSGEKNAIKFKAISTRMMCMGEGMNIENKFNNALLSASQYKIAGSTLTLLDEKGTVLADFVASK